MAYVRRNVWSLQQPWDPQLLWYARGIKVLRSRPFKDVTSWKYLAAIHGIDAGIWAVFGWLSAGEKPPQTPEYRNQDRGQCQHHGWYFLPWHRAYLASFEAIVRAAIESLPGHPTDWALPYWNYNDANAATPRALPAAFASKTWPDGGSNPLYEKRRYGRGDGVVQIRAVDVDLTQALTDQDFEGVLNGSPGFGGVRTPFQHNADRRHEGWVEQRPHDVVHGLVGGAAAGTDPDDPLNWGLMSNPDTAGLDPIFWLHHANLDRLWEVWLKRRGSEGNPAVASWLNGPSGTRKFILPRPNGTRKVYKPSDVLNTAAPGLNYVYDDVSDPLGSESRLEGRLESLDLPPEVVTRLKAKQVTKKPQVELLGANAKAVTLRNSPAQTEIQVDGPTARKLAKSFSLEEGVMEGEPDRVFLNLENITGTNDAGVFDVYVGLPDGADPAQHPENRAGVVSLFGLKNSTEMAQPHGGAGLSKTLEITATIDRLHLSNADLSTVPVSFVPVSGIGEAGISIKRVSIYRQSR